MTKLSGTIAVLSSDKTFLYTRDLGPNLVDVKDGLVLPLEDIDPPFDPITQVKLGPDVVVTQSKVTRTWTVRNKTPQEFDAGKDLVVSSLDLTIFKVLFNHENRIRALEGKTAVTANQFKTALKGLL